MPEDILLFLHKDYLMIISSDIQRFTQRLNRIHQCEVVGTGY